MEPADRTAPSISVLMSCFNRRDLTLGCLEALYGLQAAEPRHLTTILVDDGSTDGTAAAVRDRFPQVHVIAGKGNLYWNGGMRVAFGEALKEGFDYYLWLNDDTMLMPDALDVLLRTSRELAVKGITAIVTASTCDSSGKRSYGGVHVSKGLVTRKLVPVDPSMTEAVACDTMNGNCTLIPGAVADKIGNLEAGFTHSFGDLDYGFRAKAAGFGVYTAPGYLGRCSDNSRSGTWRDTKSSFRKRWKHLTSPKGSPFKEWALYCRRHQGPLWPLYVISPYAKTLLLR